jgi:hypothetical protein
MRPSESVSTAAAAIAASAGVRTGIVRIAVPSWMRRVASASAVSSAIPSHEYPSVAKTAA